MCWDTNSRMSGSRLMLFCFPLPIMSGVKINNNKKKTALSTRSKIHSKLSSEKINARHVQWSMQGLKVSLATEHLPVDPLPLLIEQICFRKLLGEMSCKEESILLSRLQHLDLHTTVWLFKYRFLIELDQNNNWMDKKRYRVSLYLHLPLEWKVCGH